MAGQVITITSGKGGVGKTTLSANVSAALAKLGKKTIAVDTDVGLRNLDIVMGLENRIVFDLVDVVEGRCDLSKACIRDRRIPSLQLLPAAQTRDKTAVSPNAMRKVCDDLRSLCDYVIIDSPAGIENGFETATIGADNVIIVVTPHVSSVRDADRVIGLLESRDKQDIHLVINRLQPEMVRRGDMLGINDVMEILAVDLLGIVPEDEYIVVSSNRGELATLNPDESPAGQEYQNIARRMQGEEVPFMTIDDKSNMFQRLFRMFKSK